MRLLAFDTAAAACSAALWSDDGGGGILASRRRLMERGQSESLISMIGEVMAEAGADFHDLDRLAVTVGPGAFTGVRIGLAAAKGLALAGETPLVGVTTLEAIAYAALRKGGANADAPSGTTPPTRPARILVTLAAGRRDLYCQLFAADSSPLGLSPLAPPGAMLPAEAPAFLAGIPAEGRLMLAGNGASILRDVLEAGSGPEPEGWAATAGDILYAAGAGLPDAVQVAAIAASRDPRSPEARAEPLYIHPHYAKLPEGAGPPGGISR